MVAYRTGKLEGQGCKMWYTSMERDREHKAGIEKKNVYALLYGNQINASTLIAQSVISYGSLCQ